MLWSLSLSFDFHDTHTHTHTQNMIGTSKMLSDDGDEEEDAAV